MALPEPSFSVPVTEASKALLKRLRETGAEELDTFARMIIRLQRGLNDIYITWGGTKDNPAVFLRVAPVCDLNKFTLKPEFLEILDEFASLEGVNFGKSTYRSNNL